MVCIIVIEDNTHHKILLKRPYIACLKAYILYICNIVIYLWCVLIIYNKNTQDSKES